MDQESGFHNRAVHIALKIRLLLISLTNEPSEYDKITPKIEYWIEYVLRERFATVDELVEGVSRAAWDQGGSYAGVGQFLKEFRDAPHRSEEAISFVDKLCEHVLRWFAIASAENLDWSSGSVARRGGNGYVRAASFVGHLIEWDLLGHELVRRHLVKPLITHHYTDGDDAEGTVRAKAAYKLFLAAGNTLLRGLLEPEDVQVCFEILNAQISLGRILGLDAGKLRELREIHTAWLEQRDAAGSEECTSEGGDTLVAEVPAEIETPVAFVPRDLPTIAVDIDIPSSIPCPVEPSPEPFVNIPATELSSPTFSISTISDLSPTEFDEEVEPSGEQATTRHNTFYFEDGNVEIVCGDTVFRVHSTVISFSSSKLRDILSSSLLHAPIPKGCSRIVFNDSAEDFSILLKMIYTPGFPARYEVPEFRVFASLLRMSTKYGFSDVRGQLLKDLESAYPTKWEAYQAAEVLGEDVFGTPRPHPNAVLDLFVVQDIRFAIPFAAYRASLGGFSSLMSDEPGTVLPRDILASAIHGRGEILRVMTQAAYAIAHKEKLVLVCPDTTCVLNVSMRPMERRVGALAKLHNVMIGEREGGVLSPPSFGDFACAKCAKEMEASHVTWRRACWELLPVAFSVARRWNEV